MAEFIIQWVDESYIVNLDDEFIADFDSLYDAVRYALDCQVHHPRDARVIIESAAEEK